MTETTPQKSTPKKETPRWRRVVRWLPPGLLFALVAVAWGVALFVGGLQAVASYYLLQVGAFIGVPTLLAVAIYAAVRRRLSAPIVATALAALLLSWPTGWAFGVLAIPYPASLEDTTPTATGRVPMDGDVLVLWGGDALEHNYHAAHPDQRWAYDLALAPALTGSANLEDYGCYGQPVLAPLDATVHKVLDGEPDATPAEPPNNPSAPLGNHVALKLDTDSYLVFAHLKPGSVAVKEGRQVVEGDQLGLCGNSGNTSEPHLHVHHQRQDPSQFPVGFAEGLPLFFRDHGGAPMPRGGLEVDGESVKATGDMIRHGGR